jgi:hypothetical protein
MINSTVSSLPTIVRSKHKKSKLPAVPLGAIMLREQRLPAPALRNKFSCFSPRALHSHFERETCAVSSLLL